MHRILRFAIAFVLLSIAIQWISTSIHVTGPIDLIERWILPNIVASNYDYYNCPPDRFIDPTFTDGIDDDGRNSNDDINGASLYSDKFDPRTKVVRQTYLPHCALQRWVEHREEENQFVRGGSGGGSNSCPEGEEYATVLRSPSSLIHHQHHHDDSSEEQHESRIPKILHIASPTNCLPLSVVRSLKRIVESSPLNHHNHHHQHRQQLNMESQQLAIYIHSHQSMHNYLITKEFPTFPEVKEGVLCGMRKIEAASRLAVIELLGREEEDDADAEDESILRRQQNIIDGISFGVLIDIWQYLILWEYGGIAMDLSTLLAILEDGNDNNIMNSINAANSTSTKTTTTTTSENGDARLHRLMQQWWTNETSSDALIYFLSNYFDDEQSTTPPERVPLPNILGATPHHPFIYTTAKSALRYAIWDEEKSITTTGRTTQIPPIKNGLMYVNRDWEKVKTGDIVNVLGYGMRSNNSIHLLNGNDVLPLSITSPNKTPWRSIFAAFATPTTNGSGDEDRRGKITNDANNMPSEAKIMEVMQRIASEQIYMSTTSLFSCMKYRLDMYTQRDDNSKMQR